MCSSAAPFTLPARHKKWTCLRSLSVPDATTNTDRGVDGDGARLFITNSGEKIKVLGCDYGFRTGSGRLYQEQYGEVPKNIFEMAADNFQHELEALRRSFRYDEYREMYRRRPPTTIVDKVTSGAAGLFVGALGALDKRLEAWGVLKELTPPPGIAQLMGDENSMAKEYKEMLGRISKLDLSNSRVDEREKRRIAVEGDVAAPWFIRLPYQVVVVLLDVVFNHRPVERFWVLETVARIPYFAYISILHLYESLGFWRAGAELRKIHFAEEWNELHHLQIMESLGGDRKWIDRFLAQHAALTYYWVLILFYMVSPKYAYMFSELVENHASDTYSEFVVENEALLKSIPPPWVAVNYYKNEDLYLFDEMAVSSDPLPARRPPCNNLYDVFVNIRDDENEHVKTMKACQDVKIARDLAVKRKGEM